MNYKIAVVGTIPNDTIITHHGETIMKYGCVTHPTFALAKLLEGQGEVIPITHIHKKDAEAIKQLFSTYKNINTDGIYDAKNQGTIIELKFVDQNNRLETQLANMCPISSEDVQPFLDSDCFIFVPITDFEIQLDTLKYIKQHSKASIVFDAHGPTSYVTDEGKRLRKFWADKHDWLPYIDVLKMNLEESFCCWFDKVYGEEVHYDENETTHLDDFAASILDAGVKTLCVTLDARGCALYTRIDGDIKKDFVPSVPVSYVIDTTGCGDSFAGGLAYGITVHNDVIKAAHFANTLGALRTQGRDFEVFKSLTEAEAIIQKNYHTKT